MKYIAFMLTALLVFSGCSQKEISDGASDIGNDIKRVIRGEN